MICVYVEGKKSTAMMMDGYGSEGVGVIVSHLWGYIPPARVHPVALCRPTCTYMKKRQKILYDLWYYLVSRIVVPQMYEPGN